MYKFRILTIVWTLHNASPPERYNSLENLQLELEAYVIYNKFIYDISISEDPENFARALYV